MATPAIANTIAVPVARVTSAGLYPSRIQADGFSICIGEAGTNCMGWVDWLGLVGVVWEAFMV